jgi:hypothetical protein
VRESRMPGSARGGRGNPVPYRYRINGSLPSVGKDEIQPFDHCVRFFPARRRRRPSSVILYPLDRHEPGENGRWRGSTELALTFNGQMSHTGPMSDDRDDLMLNMLRGIRDVIATLGERQETMP